MNVIYTIIVAIFVLFIITFSLDNSDPVKLSYYGYFHREMPLYLIVFVSFLIGVVFTGFLGMVERFRQNRTIKHLNKTIRDLHREIRARENPLAASSLNPGDKTVSQDNSEKK